MRTLLVLAVLLLTPTLATAQQADLLGSPTSEAQERAGLLHEIRARNADRRERATRTALQDEGSRLGGTSELQQAPRRPRLGGPLAVMLGGLGAGALSIGIGVLVQNFGTTTLDVTACYVSLGTVCEPSEPDRTWIAVPAALGAAAFTAGLVWMIAELSSARRVPETLVPSLELGRHGGTLGIAGRF